LALTEALPATVNVQVFALLPPLEQAPDQIASRPLETVSVIGVPVANVAEPVLPTATLIPAGLEVTLSPLLPVAVTVTVADCAAGFTDSVAVLVALPKTPLIVTAVDAVTPVVPIAKFALSAPAATVTFAGTLATVALLLDSATLAPPMGAAVVNVTVPVAGAPPTTLVGLTVTVDKLGPAAAGLTVSAAVRETPPKVPEIVSAVEAVTVFVVMVKVALVVPAATVTLAGTVATAGLALLRLTTAPPVGAPPVSVTVPWEVLPPTTDTGFTLTAERLAAAGGGAPGMTVRLADCVELPKKPVMMTGVFVETGNVVTVKLAKPWPAGTLTIGGT
jgi:hypothetical protein